MPKQKDLPGVEGEGVSPVRIAEVDEACDEYVKLRDKRCTLTPKEIAAKAKLIDAIHSNAKKLPRNAEGSIVYQNSDFKISLAPGQEKLKVKEVNSDDA